MKIQINDKVVLELSDIRKKVICNDIPQSLFKSDMERRVAWVIYHKYERCMERLKQKWIPKLKERGVATIPLDDDLLADLIFSQPDYQDRENREKTESQQQI